MATKASSKKPVTKTAVKKAETSTEAKSESKKATNLPKELFGGDVNKPLLAQAVRVYLANQREGSAKTKTRGEVEGSTRKIFRQKGTGRARHGGIRAPIFVGGGIVFGPVPRDFRLTMNKKMKRAALVSSLSARKSSVLVVDDLVMNEPKTKTVAALFDGMSITGSILFVLPEKSDIVMKATRNIPFVHAIHARDIHPYAILTNKHIVFTKAALEESKTYFTK